MVYFYWIPFLSVFKSPQWWCAAQWTIMIACLVQLLNDGDFPVNRVHNLRSFWWFSSPSSSSEGNYRPKPWQPTLEEVHKKQFGSTLVYSHSNWSKFIKNYLDLTHLHVFSQHSTCTYRPCLHLENKQSSLLQNIHFFAQSQCHQDGKEYNSWYNWSAEASSDRSTSSLTLICEHPEN